MAKKKAKAAKIEYPTCVRHLKPRKDVRIRNYFLCDGCTKQWTEEAFDGNEPLFVGEPVEGYCLLCNELFEDVRLRSWFLCDICDRVAGSIGRNHVAEKSILDYWTEKVIPEHPSLELIQNDVASLRPRRDTDVSAQAPIDFIARDRETGDDVFGIENKTGRSSVKDMSQFQLDTSDCDTILNDMKKLQIPAYIFHAHVLELWKPPTVGFRIIGLWWSDVYSMTEHFKSIRTRRDEMRGAAYFSKKAFQHIDTFIEEELTDDGDYPIARRFKKQGIPTMYET